MTITDTYQKMIDQYFSSTNTFANSIFGEFRDGLVLLDKSEFTRAFTGCYFSKEKDMYYFIDDDKKKINDVPKNMISEFLINEFEIFFDESIIDGYIMNDVTECEGCLEALKNMFKLTIVQSFALIIRNQKSFELIKLFGDEYENRVNHV